MVIDIKSGDLLSEEQLKHHIKVYAGPGAGKTHFLVENIKNIIKTDAKLKNSKTRKVLCVTYTNAAVDEINKRLELYKNELEVFTIHGFIIEYIIKPYQSELKKHMFSDFGIKIETNEKITSQIEGLGILHGYDKQEIFSYVNKINDTNEDISYSKKIMGEVEVDIDKYLSENISTIKKSNSISENHKIPLKKYLWTEAKKLTHNEILYFGYKIATENSTIAYALRVQFPYIFIDEFQDTHPLQAKLMKYLGEKSTIIGVIGDKAQSIYSFQGAKPSQFIEFNLTADTSHTDTWEYNIVGNRRSTENIIKLCNYIRNSDVLQQVSIKKYSDNTQKNAIEQNKVVFLLGESSAINEKIANIVDSGGVILTRTWAAAFNYMFGVDEPQKRILRNVYNSYFASPIDIRAEIAELTEITNVTWVRAFKFIILLYDAYTTKSVNSILKAFQLYINIGNLKNNQSFNAQIIIMLNNFLIELFENLPNEKSMVDIIDNFNNCVNREEYSKLKELLVRYSKIPSDFFKITYFNEEDRDNLVDNVRSLEWLTAYKLFKTVFSSDSKYMTVHQAKGLEWKQVIVSLEPSQRFDGILFLEMFANPAILNETSQDEFTRMFYVACSRAEEQLYIHIRTEHSLFVVDKLKSFIGDLDFNLSFEMVR